MKLRGWLYVITNKAMPGLVKIGYSTKDPHLRAIELDGTGMPHPYEVIYDILLYEPRDVEQMVHALLKDKREAKEWFRCSLEEAITVIRSITSDYQITTVENGMKKMELEEKEEKKHLIAQARGDKLWEFFENEIKLGEKEERNNWISKNWTNTLWEFETELVNNLQTTRLQGKVTRFIFYRDGSEKEFTISRGSNDKEAFITVVSYWGEKEERNDPISKDWRDTLWEIETELINNLEIMRLRGKVTRCIFYREGLLKAYEISRGSNDKEAFMIVVSYKVPDDPMISNKREEVEKKEYHISE